MSGSHSKSNDLHKAHADAYRAYLRSLRDSLAKVDIEAIDIPKLQAGRPPSLGTFNCIHCIQTWYTYYTWYTFHTYNTLGCEACIEE